jgi:hypothetical protein
MLKGYYAESFQSGTEYFEKLLLAARVDEDTFQIIVDECKKLGDHALAETMLNQAHKLGYFNVKL